MATSLLDPRPREVINATGIVVHTNLGRAVLSEAAAEQLAAASRGYLDLEYDVDGGKRGDRLAHLTPLMAVLFPGRGFAAVNNNAAAVMLCLRALSAGKDVLVSRGELVEIGGSFRVPEIMAASGARLREVGTTNRTRVADFEAALSAETGLILRVHTSNFKVVGFTEEPEIDRLAALARKAEVPLVVDWGSGDLVDLEPLEIRDRDPGAPRAGAGRRSGDLQRGQAAGERSGGIHCRPGPIWSSACVATPWRGSAGWIACASVRCTRRWPLTSGDGRSRRFRRYGCWRRNRRRSGGAPAALRKAVVKRSGATGCIELIDGVSRTGGGSSPTGERPTRLLAVSSSGTPGRSSGSCASDGRRSSDGFRTRACCWT